MFKEIDFMSKLRTFLVKYPALAPHETLEIDFMDIDPQSVRRPEGEAVAFVGSSIVNESVDILGYTVHDEQSNFILVLRRFTNDNEFRRDVGNFLINYIRWINYEQSRRGKPDEHPDLPKFSMTNEERIRANGGLQTGVEISAGVDEYQLQIQCFYQTVYEVEW